MKVFIPITIAIITVSIITLPLFAKQLVIPAEMTCSDFLTYDSNEQEDIVYSLKEKQAGDQIINIKEMYTHTINDQVINDEKVILTHIDDAENKKIIELCKNDKKANLSFKLKLYWESN
jgi:hypothetical protein